MVIACLGTLCCALKNHQSQLGRHKKDLVEGDGRTLVDRQGNKLIRVQVSNLVYSSNLLFISLGWNFKIR